MQQGLRFYTGEKGSGEIVCDKSSDLTDSHNFVSDAYCENDKVKSMIIHHADVNTLISLFDDAEGTEGVDDELYIHVRKYFNSSSNISLISQYQKKKYKCYILDWS